MVGCTGLTTLSLMEGVLIPICGPTYRIIRHPSCIPPQGSSTQMTSKHSYSLRATRRPCRGISDGWQSMA